jgi:hypothetical protein
MPPSAPPSPGREEREKALQPQLSEHDKVNTVNVAELLRTAEFKLVPGVDRVPYEELIKLRLEDGVDVTRKVCMVSCGAWKGDSWMERVAGAASTVLVSWAGCSIRPHAAEVAFKSPAALHLSQQKPRRVASCCR